MLTINNTVEGYLKNVEIKGNTIQNPANLADIKSVGDKVEGQELYKIPLLSVGKNLFDKSKIIIQSTLNTDGTIANSSDRNVSDFIKVKPACRYFGVENNMRVAFYDSTKTFLSLDIQAGARLVPSNATYMRFVMSEVSIDRIQIEEGTVATSFEAYQSNELTILSPVQIEKVGDVEDRIVERDGVWGVEKNTPNSIFNGTENWISSGWANQTNTIAFKISNFSSRSDVSISDKFTFNANISTTDIESFRVLSAYNEVAIRINKAKLATQDIAGFKAWLQSNPTLVKYQTATPTFIPLPHAQQVKLRTFANKTNISFLCETEGTIKADVPKSLGSVVNVHTEEIDNIYTELDRVKKLEQSTVSTVTTDKDFVSVQETTQGYFEDVELNGRTLVNLAINSQGKEVTPSDFNYDVRHSCHIGSTYTVIVNNIPNGEGFRVGFLNKHGNGWYDNKPATIDYSNSELIMFKIDLTNDDLGVLRIQGKGDGASVSATKNHIVNNVLILEGDHTQNPPSYFEGLKSVGEGTDEIVVSSTNGEYLKSYLQGQGLVSENGNLYGNANRTTLDFHEIDNSLKYRIFDAKFVTVCFYNDNYNYVGKIDCAGEVDTEISCPSTSKYIRVTFYSDYSQTMNMCKSNIENKTDKKKLLYFDAADNTWKKPVLDEFSTVKKGSDGVYRYYKMGEKVVLNGSESWFCNTPAQPNTLRFSLLTEIGAKKIENIGVISDKLDCVYGIYTDKEGIHSKTNDSGLGIRINPNKLTTQDVGGIKAWLQANNVTVVYQLAKEKVYECTNIDLITYENETNFTVKSGVLSPRTTLKVHSNISNVVSLLQKKVSLLESNVSKYMITQNRLMLTSRYNADNATFKIDYNNTLNDSIQNEVDEDLFKLLYQNIIVGKENYDYDKMIEIIDFYAFNGFINWDMWDAIWLAMELQHNPPVEEEIQ